MGDQQERARAIGREIDRRYPKGSPAQQKFKMYYNMHRQGGDSEAESEARAIATVREQYPGFAPVRR